MNDLRTHIVNSLKGGQAFIPIEKAIANVDPKIRNVRPNDHLHSIWEELEHLRIAQEDIYQYMIDADWESPEWPDNYWADPATNVTDKIWEKTHSGFLKDLNDVIKLVENPDIDLLKVIPYTKSHTYLRECLILIEHNAYHIGKIIDIRKALGDWK